MNNTHKLIHAFHRVKPTIGQVCTAKDGTKYRYDTHTTNSYNVCRMWHECAIAGETSEDRIDLHGTISIFPNYKMDNDHGIEYVHSVTIRTLAVMK